MAIDLSQLAKSLSRLEEGLMEYRADPSRTLLRDGLIQRFEFTYDLAPKLLRRVLAIRSDSPSEVDRMTFPTLMRTAFEQGLVDVEWPKWLDYREKRNITSHTYDEEKAKGVVDRIPGFIEDARALLARLEQAD